MVTDLDLVAIEARVVRKQCKQNIAYKTIGSFAPFSTSPSDLDAFLRKHHNLVTTTYLFDNTDNGWKWKGRTGVYDLITQSYSGGSGHTHKLADDTMIRIFNEVQSSANRPYYASGRLIPYEENGNKYRVSGLQCATFGDIYLLWRLQAEFFNQYTTGWPHILVAMNPSMVKERIIQCPNGVKGEDIPLGDGAIMLVNSSGVSVTDYVPDDYTCYHWPKGELWTTVKYDRNVDPDRRPADINIAVGVTISFGPQIGIKPIIGFEYQGNLFNIDDLGWESFDPEILKLQEKPKDETPSGFDLGWTVATFLNYNGDLQEGELLTKGSVIIPGTIRLFDSIDFSIIRPLFERSGLVKGLDNVRSQDVQATLVNITRVGNSREMKLTFRLIYKPNGLEIR